MLYNIIQYNIITSLFHIKILKKYLRKFLKMKNKIK